MSGFNPATLLGSANGIFLDAKAFCSNNAVSLDGLFFNQWEGPFNPYNINHLDSYWNASTGFIYSGWRIAVFNRGELFLEANKDTIEILQMINRRENLPIGRTFDINLDGTGFSARGIELSKGFRISEWGEVLLIGFTARYLSGDKIQQGTITGSASPVSSSSYDFDLQLNYTYDKNLVYDRRDTVPGTGNGYSFDIGLKHDFTDYLSAELLFRDILGRIYWNHMPYTDAVGTSSTKYFDENGYMIFKPIISGYEGNKDYVQRITSKTDLALTYKNDFLRITPSINFIGERPLYWVDVGFYIDKAFSLNTGYNLNYNCYSLGVTYKKASFNVYTDNIDYQRAKAVGISLFLQYDW
ncbi:MAG: hypothetical protein ABSB79_06065 [Syntrophales bacterium]